jgi:hypothetical protein
MFNVSDKLVCVDDSPNANTGETVPLKKGAIYVVRGMDLDEDILGMVGVLLVGLTTGVRTCRDGTGGELGFAASRFRKLSEVQAENRLKASVGNMQESTATP